MKHSPNILLSAGNKNEDPSKNSVGVSVVKNFAEEENLEYMEMSAKSGENVEEVIFLRRLSLTIFFNLMYFVVFTIQNFPKFNFSIIDNNLIALFFSNIKDRIMKTKSNTFADSLLQISVQES